MKKFLNFFSESPCYDSVILMINEEAFGPGRFARTAMRLREQGEHDRQVSFVCEHDQAIVASVRMTPIIISDVKGYMLGPLAVRSSYAKQGIGRKLVQLAVDSSKENGSEVVLLIGDPAYYKQIGFQQIKEKTLELPGPVNPRKLMFYPLVENVSERLKGVVRWRKIDL
ncbi:putative acetyltransferase protein [Liberibacter crescens BT-1]|uniref:Putative acetyltransferase protein n=1 Tax=Liberibacter crescens (strain BT-1) TaxID=1215343 RepID=L0EVE5_LIBCB|nr:N-acetyltransferase [Liberibacter crescens]AGA64830.1 putative acetyltransferase protein [Liberibacter crescens BT-1]AMC12885.1 GCN5 family acetyltransferase [Liberibacter crescens]